MSDNIDDIQDARYHMRRGTYFNLLIMYYVRVGLHGPGWLYVPGMPPRANVPLSTPSVRATDLDRGPNLRMGSVAHALGVESGTSARGAIPSTQSHPGPCKPTYIIHY